MGLIRLGLYVLSYDLALYCVSIGISFCLRFQVILFSSNLLCYV